MLNDLCDGQVVIFDSKAIVKLTYKRGKEQCVICLHLDLKLCICFLNNLTEKELICYMYISYFHDEIIGEKVISTPNMFISMVG